MRLIDADALKEEYVKLGHCAETYEELYTNTEKLIDNAQTVEYPFYQEAYQTGYEEGFNEGAKVVVDTVNKANKTPLYGADMIRGEEE